MAAALRQIADRIDRSVNPSHSLVLRDIRSVVASLRTADGVVSQTAAPAAPDQKAIEEALYGHSGGETDPNMMGSSIWWLVFNEMGIEDWTPISDYPTIEAKAKELLDEWSKGWHESFTPEEKQQRIDTSIAQLKENWQDYQKHYMPEHVKLLKEKGLM